MKEIEVKIEVDSLAPIIEKLTELGCEVSAPMIQSDVIFYKKDPGSEGKVYLRIRKSNGKCLFTLKINVSDELDCVEKEVEVADPETIKDIIELLGYIELSRVKKKRIKCNFKNYEICLDDVENLGFFIEIEEMSDENVELVRNDMLNFLESLGVDISRRIFRGYDTLAEERKSLQI